MNKKGFTLLEVLMCMVILAFGLLALAGMQIMAIKGNHFGNKVTNATILAHNTLEDLKNLSFSDPELSVGESSDQITKSGTVFTIQKDVALVGDSMKRITAEVKWIDRGEHSVSLSTIKSK